MLSPRVYLEAYSIPAIELDPALPPLFRLRSLSGSPLLTTSPYLTDTEDFPRDPGAQERFRELAIETCRRTGSAYALIKTRDPEFRARLEPELRVSEQFVTSLLDLTPGEEEVWKSALHSKRRRQVQKGYGAQPRFKVGREELLEPFYRVFSATQSDLGTPVHSRKYFESILRFHPEAELIVGEVEGSPVSVALLLIRGERIYHPYTGTLAAHHPTYVNCTLYWEIIRHGIQRGCKVFDLGRSFKDSGVHQFKKYWGTRDVPLFYCYFLHRQRELPRLDSSLMKIATGLWRHLPLGVSERVGPHLIRCIP